MIIKHPSFTNEIQMFARDEFSFIFQICQHRQKIKTSAIKVHLNYQFICHSHHSTMGFNRIDSPISKKKNILHTQNSYHQVFRKQPHTIMIMLRWNMMHSHMHLDFAPNLYYDMPNKVKSNFLWRCHLHINESITNED